jgi:Golgi phosphoprotein 3 (GPP34)
MVQLPQPLHAQLYLLSWNPERRCFQCDDRWNARWLFGYALDSAMLTDLYLTGYIEDRAGRAYRVHSGRHEDPILNEALQGVSGKKWGKLVAYNVPRCRQRVYHQLEMSGWISVQRRRMFGVIPARDHVYDENVISGLADRVTDALRNAIDARPADPRPLALGLIAALAQMPVVDALVDDPKRREALREMTFCAIEPILGLHEAIQEHLSEMRSDVGCSGGGCGGGS